MESMAWRAVACLSIASVMVGCASTYEPVDNRYVGSQKSATIILSPSDAPIYRQIVDDDRRVAEIEFNPFQEGMVASGTLAASYGVLFWGGSVVGASGSAAVGGSASVAATTSVVLPGLALGLAGLATATGAVVDSYRYGRAEASVAQHSELLQGHDVDEFAKTIVASSLSEFSHLQVATVTGVDDWLLPQTESANQDLFDDLKRSLATRRDAASDSFEAVLSQIGSDFVITLAYFPQFSPNFEVLEVHALVSIYDQASETPQQPVYSNAIFYQSVPHGGLYLADTRQVNDEFIEWYRQQAAWRESRYGRDKLSGHQKLDINHQMRQKRYTLERNYTLVDKHDPDGQLWLQDGGQPMFSALQEGIREIVRLAVYDVNADRDETDMEMRSLPGTALEMRFIDSISNDKRHIYRSDGGALHSVGAYSRFVLYESVN